MAGYKETPRQKMIGMMYLVLTALLALNVSVEILQAFIIVNESMESTNQTFAKKIDECYDLSPEHYLELRKSVFLFCKARLSDPQIIDENFGLFKRVGRCP